MSKPKMFETDNKAIYLLVNDKEIIIKERLFKFGSRAGEVKLWKVYVPLRAELSPWNCVDYLGFDCKNRMQYKYSHESFLPACDLDKLRETISKRLKMKLPKAAFDYYEGKRMASALVNVQ